MAYLILVRHGQSEWNKQGLWTGWTDIHLSEEGRHEARMAAEALSTIRLDMAYTSTLSRAVETLEEILTELHKLEIPVYQDDALRERNYGEYTGKNKWEVQKQVGDEEFQKIRRSWDHPIPNGESLKDVYNRVVPYFEQEILPKLKEGKNILISAHGNSLRALVKYLETIPDEKIAELEIGTGEAWVYEIDSNGQVGKREVRATNPDRGKQ